MVRNAEALDLRLFLASFRAAAFYLGPVSHAKSTLHLAIGTSVKSAPLFNPDEMYSAGTTLMRGFLTAPGERTDARRSFQFKTGVFVADQGR